MSPAGELGGSALAIIAGALLCLLLVVFAIRRARARHPYRRSGALFSPAELRFLGVLERAVEDRACVYGKVRLADLVTVRDGVSGRRFWKAFHSVACKHVDYVLCDRDRREVLCVIELDDRSHERADRADRDVFVDAVMRAAGIPIFHFPVRARYSIGELRESLEGVLLR